MILFSGMDGFWEMLKEKSLSLFKHTHLPCYKLLKKGSRRPQLCSSYLLDLYAKVNSIIWNTIFCTRYHTLFILFSLHLFLLSSLPMCTQICWLLSNPTACFSLLYSFFFQNFGLNISELLKTQKITLFSYDMNTFFLAAFWVKQKKRCLHTEDPEYQEQL